MHDAKLNNIEADHIDEKPYIKMNSVSKIEISDFEGLNDAVFESETNIEF